LNVDEKTLKPCVAFKKRKNEVSKSSDVNDIYDSVCTENVSLRHCSAMWTVVIVGVWTAWEVSWLEQLFIKDLIVVSISNKLCIERILRT
jgi:hypothetical protein